jgi:malonyl-CoA/methylmalonyl-CoA synthetase
MMPPGPGPRPAAELPLVARAQRHGDRLAISATEGTFTYRELLDASARVAAQLLAEGSDLAEQRVALLAPAGFAYVAAQWGIWRAGGVVVPLATSHPPAELEYMIRDADASAVLVHPDLAAVLDRVMLRSSVRRISISEAMGTAPCSVLPVVADGRRAMMIYTSGTTGRSKGVVTTHANLAAQVTSLITAWEWSGDDRILLVLPLHHVHGIINVLTCALWTGARCEMPPRFDAEQVWSRFVEGGLTLFMAVPTIYSKLIAAWEAAPPERRRVMTDACRGLRLMVSGSAALPVQTLERWKEVSGHVLLERYGMTEIGMGLSNPFRGERRPGCVGAPLPGVEVRLVSDSGAPVASGTPGEIEVRGPGVFLEYWRRPEETAAAFRDGWFRTGDVAVVERGAYRILGRRSVDIIKTGGYKVSALEIEEVLRAHPDIVDCAVVGVDDPEWGERVCAAVELRGERHLTLGELQAWAGERLAPYKLPRAVRCVSALPRNAVGKVMKPEVAKLFDLTP